MPEEHEIEEVSDAASDNDYEDSKGPEEGDTMADQKSISENSNVESMAESATSVAKPKLDPKDPLRPRRKKARRACFACQRAHLTCGEFQGFLSLTHCCLFIILVSAISRRQVRLNEPPTDQPESI